MYYGSSVEAIKEACRAAGVRYYTGLSSSLLDSVGGSTPVSPAIIGAVAGGAAAILTTIMIIPMMRKRR